MIHNHIRVPTAGIASAFLGRIDFVESFVSCLSRPRSSLALSRPTNMIVMIVIRFFGIQQTCPSVPLSTRMDGTRLRGLETGKRPSVLRRRWWARWDDVGVVLVARPMPRLLIRGNCLTPCHGNFQSSFEGNPLSMPPMPSMAPTPMPPMPPMSYCGIYPSTLPSCTTLSSL